MKSLARLVQKESSMVENNPKEFPIFLQVNLAPDLGSTACSGMLRLAAIVSALALSEKKGTCRVLLPVRANAQIPLHIL